MKIRLSLLAVAFTFLALGLTVAPSSRVVRAEEGESEVTVEQSDDTASELVQAEDSTASDEAQSVNYNYQAQAGDSYTKMARKAVQTYGILKGINLSGAQIIFAETNLTKAAEWPALDLGQEVSIKESDVQSLVEQAQNLTPEQEAAWNYYVQFVDFNTNGVGEAQA